MRNINSILLLPILLTCVVVNDTHAEVYKHVDKDGYVTYSDKPVKGTTKPHIPEPINTIKKDNKSSRKQTSSRRGADGDDEEGKKAAAKAIVPNYTLSISTPTEGEVVRANAGSVTVQVAITPPLNTTNNHQIVVKLDGQAKQSQSTAVTFTEVSRGPHTLTAEITGEHGEVLTQSSPVTIQVLRRSAIAH